MWPDDRHCCLRDGQGKQCPHPPLLTSPEPPPAPIRHTHILPHQFTGAAQRSGAASQGGQGGRKLALGPRPCVRAAVPDEDTGGPWPTATTLNRRALNFTYRRGERGSADRARPPLQGLNTDPSCPNTDAGHIPASVQQQQHGLPRWARNASGHSPDRTLLSRPGPLG